MVKERKKLTPRKIAILWMLLVAIVIGVLIANEQISVLYLLATLGIVVLLLIVGFSDLEELSRRTDDREALK
jgi:Kef-type K+ transport system membrane component KefB